jgi:hypothetical protein
MPYKLPPHVERNHVKGKTYLSFRIGQGSRIRLPDDPRSKEFQEAYHAALLGQMSTQHQRKLPPAPGTIGDLIVSYMKSDAYRNLRATTKKGYSSRIEALRADHGHRAVFRLTHAREDRRRVSCGLPRSPRSGALAPKDVAYPAASRRPRVFRKPCGLQSIGRLAALNRPWREARPARDRCSRSFEPSVCRNKAPQDWRNSSVAGCRDSSL